MGQDCRLNRAISSVLFHRILVEVEERAMESEVRQERDKWILGGGYFCFCYNLSLRGAEGLMVDLAGFIEHNQRDRLSHIIVPLLGRVKGEGHSRQHLMHSVTITDSGIPVKGRIDRLLALHARNGKFMGPVFVNPESSTQMTHSEMNDMLVDVLESLFEEDGELFAIDIKVACE